MNHQAHNPMPGRADYVHISDRQCPLCEALLIRTPRRPVDRLWSVFQPVLRYRCQRFACQWHGNLPRRTADGAVTGKAARDTTRQKVPASFITHMLLAVGGAALVFVLGNTESLAWHQAFSVHRDDSQLTASSAAQRHTPGLQSIQAVAGSGPADTKVRRTSRN